jgi:WD40 repeat protein
MKRVRAYSESSIDSDALEESYTNKLPSSSEGEDSFFEESVDEKRMRLAMEVIEDAKQRDRKKKKQNDLNSTDDSAGEDDSSESEDDEYINDILVEDLEETKEAKKRVLGDKIEFSPSSTLFKTEATVTCVDISSRMTAVVTKDGSLYLMSADSKKLELIWKVRDKTALNSVVIFNEKFVICGGKNKIIYVIDVLAKKVYTQMRSCQQEITGLVLVKSDDKSTRNTSDNQIETILLASSYDKSIKQFSILSNDETFSIAYVESFFGHTSQIYTLDAVSLLSAVTTGSDNTARLWNIKNDSHVIWTVDGGTSEFSECACLIDSKHAVVGTQSGKIMVFGKSYKKAMTSIDLGYGGVTAIASIKNTDLVFAGFRNKLAVFSCKRPAIIEKVSGSKGIKLELTLVTEMEIKGIVTSVYVNEEAIIVGVGRDHRLGRWVVEKTAKNGIYKIPYKIL